MSGFFGEFKKFILRGNVMDMAVGVLVGGAFSGLVGSLTENIISPVIGMAGGTNFDEYALEVNGAVIAYGKFITAVINFVILAFVVFCLLKAVNKVIEAGKKPEAPAAPTTKICPHCQSEINIKATKCPFCTSDVE